jgi:hypothetical protein
MKLLLASVMLFSSSLFASADGVYNCQGIKYSTGQTFEVSATPLKIKVVVDGNELVTVNQDKNCMVITEKTSVSDLDGKTVIKSLSAFQTGCKQSDMMKNNVQLIMNMSSTERTASLFITENWKLTQEVIVYCK